MFSQETVININKKKTEKRTNQEKIKGKLFITGCKKSASKYAILDGNKKIELFQAKEPQPAKRSLVT